MKRYFQMGSAMIEDLSGKAKWVKADEAEARIKELKEENERHHRIAEKFIELNRKNKVQLARGQVTILEAIEEMNDSLIRVAEILKDMIPKCDCPPDGTTLEAGSSWYCPIHGRMYV